MSINNFIPQVWSAKLLQNLHKQYVYAALANTDYEGEIKAQGDTVRINGIGPVTVSNYTKNSNMSAPETLQDASAVLTIDQAKYFNFQIDDVDKVQQNPKLMSEAMREAAFAMGDVVDQYVAGLYAIVNVKSTNIIGTTGSPKTDLGTAGQPYVYLTQLMAKLDTNNVPRTGRWVVVPPWFHALLLLDTRFTGYGTQVNVNNLVNGNVGAAAGFDIYLSNNVPYVTASGTDDHIIAGWRGAAGFADQFTEVEAYRPELRFADAMKGLHLYGGKLLRPQAVAMLIATAA